MEGGPSGQPGPVAYRQTADLHEPFRRMRTASRSVAPSSAREYPCRARRAGYRAGPDEIQEGRGQCRAQRFEVDHAASRHAGFLPPSPRHRPFPAWWRLS